MRRKRKCKSELIEGVALRVCQHLLPTKVIVSFAARGKGILELSHITRPLLNMQVLLSYRYFKRG